uniref:(northern house mosquito) hypothetical protein n=1 Tax=Culex pipiens TaxID=7175 RepID=A0A8D8E8T1_CULPI
MHWFRALSLWCASRRRATGSLVESAEPSSSAAVPLVPLSWWAAAAALMIWFSSTAPPSFSLSSSLPMTAAVVLASNSVDGSPPASRYFSTSPSSRSRYSTYSVSCSSSFVSSVIFCLWRAKLARTSCSHASDSELCGNRWTHIRWKSLNTLILLPFQTQFSFEKNGTKNLFPTL